MDIKDNLKSIYIYEQSLLKTICDKMLDSSSDEVHDYLLSVFDETDRLVRKELFEESDALRLLVPKESQVIACTATLNKQTRIFFCFIS